MKLLQSLLEGDEAAFEKLCGVFSETVRSMARTFVARNSASAHLKDDLISEGVLAVVAALRSLQAQPTQIESLQGYMATVIRNSFLTLVEHEQTIRTPVKRKGSKSKFKQATLDLDEVPDVDLVNVDELLEDLKVCCQTDGEFEIIKLRLLGLSDDQIASSLRVSPSTVRRCRLTVSERYRGEP